MAATTTVTPDKVKTAALKGNLDGLLDPRLTDRGLRKARQRDELDEVHESLAELGQDHLDALREVYPERPRDRVLGYVIGVLNGRAIREHYARHAGERQRRQERAASNYKRNRALGYVPTAQFFAWVIQMHRGQCPNVTTKLGPHGLEVGFMRRAGDSWACVKCGHREDARPAWIKAQEGDRDG